MARIHTPGDTDIAFLIGETTWIRLGDMESYSLAHQAWSDATEAGIRS